MVRVITSKLNKSHKFELDVPSFYLEKLKTGNQKARDSAKTV